jgi:simple sugar transport system ATP-binding protein
MSSKDPDGRQVLVEMKGITKKFDELVANDNINFNVRFGEIHTLLGENGAGKTTLMKILYGLLRPDSGEIFVEGKKVHIKSPRDAIELGIGMVHQHFMLISQHTVLENIILGMSTLPQASSKKISSDGNPVFGIVQKFIEKVSLHKAEHSEQIMDIVNRYNLRINLSSKIWQLSVGERQRVEIVKALYRGARLLILDEPTSNLTPQENENLFQALRVMVKDGLSVILITHRLHETMSISDRVTALRNGKLVGTIDRSQLSRNQLSQMIIGKEVKYADAAHMPPGKEAILRIEEVSAKNDLDIDVLNGITLSVHESEILGIAGVEGNGQRELIEVIMGLRKVEKGRIFIGGQDVTSKNTGDILRMRVAYIPQDRNTEGLIGDFTISENLILDRYDEDIFSDRFFIRGGDVQKNSLSLISKFDIRSRGPKTKAHTLSGGNAQRVIVARELSRNPVLIVANQPTRGLDIASTEFVLNALVEYRKKGCGVLLVLTELDELLRISDRVAILFQGRVQGVVNPPKTTKEEIGMLMLGGKE